MKNNQTNDSLNIGKFFSSGEDFVRFFVSLKTVGVLSKDEKFYSTLTKTGKGYWIFRIDSQDGEKWIGDYIQSVKPTKQNLEIINQGYRTLFERLMIYRKTNNYDLVPEEPPAFGEITLNDPPEYGEIIPNIDE